ncbi:type III pantothenate kinase [Acidaminobacterium chupaoyuni]
MLLAVSIGSSNIHIGLYEGKNLKVQTTMRVDTQILADEYAAKLMSALTLFKKEPSEISGVILSSVMPPLVSVIRRAVRRLTQAPMVVVGPGVKTGLKISINDPAQMGADLVSCAVGALSYYEPPMILCSMGTATTLMAIDANGALCGGTIAPGMKISLEALASHTAQLPRIDLESDCKAVIGRNTVDCMKSGILNGTAAMAEGLAQRMAEELGSEAPIILTGDYAELAAPYFRGNIKVHPALTMEGLRLIYEKNCKEPF